MSDSQKIVIKYLSFLCNSWFDEQWISSVLQLTIIFILNQSAEYFYD